MARTALTTHGSTSFPSASAGADPAAPATLFAEMETLRTRVDQMERLIRALRPQLDERMRHEYQAALEAGRDRRDWSLLTAFIERYGGQAIVELSGSN